MGYFTFTKKKSEEEWEEHLQQYAPVDEDTLRWQRSHLSNTPLQSYRRLYPTPTPHTSHRQYSQIETAKRKRDEFSRMNTTIPKQPAEPCNWVPPERYTPFQRGVPSLSRFRKAFSVRYPKW